MGGVSRYDFFRIVLPGGLVVFLLDLSARLILATPRVRPSILAAFPKFIEQPLIALAMTFGVGLILYSLDLAYYSPQIWRGIPSTVLREKIPDTRVDTTSLFFVASDQLMPAELRERALSYGSFYRLGFQVIFFTIIACLVVPVGIVLRLGNPPIVPHPRVTTAVVIATLLVVPCALTPFIREAFKRRRRLPALRFVLCIGLLVGASSAVWVDLPFAYFPKPSQDAVWFTIATAAYAFPWIGLRLLGPMKPRWTVWRSVDKLPRPDVPHSDIEIAILDTGAVVLSLVATIALSGALSNMQIIGLAVLQALALVLSFQKKHERQLQGIYRNQVTWLNAHLDEILKLVPPAEAESTPSPATIASPPPLAKQERPLRGRRRPPKA